MIAATGSTILACQVGTNEEPGSRHCECTEHREGTKGRYYETCNYYLGTVIGIDYCRY
jgi:hypothetical protein